MAAEKRLFAAAAVFCAIALTGFSQTAPALDGTWIGKTEVPGIGTCGVTLILTKADKTYRGTISSDHPGVIKPDTEVQEVTADGAKLSFAFPLADETPLFMKLAAAGEKMTGHWEHPAGSTGAVELIRKMVPVI